MFNRFYEYLVNGYTAKQGTVASVTSSLSNTASKPSCLLELEKIQIDLQANLRRWKELQIKIIRTDSLLQLYAKEKSAISTIRENLFSIKINNFFLKIFESSKNLISLEEKALFALLDSANDDIKAVMKYLNDHCDNVKDEKKSTNAIFKTLLTICAASIELVTDMLALTSTIQVQLTAYLNTEYYNEKIATAILEITRLLLKTMPLPDVEFLYQKMIDSKNQTLILENYEGGGFLFPRPSVVDTHEKELRSSFQKKW